MEAETDEMSREQGLDRCIADAVARTRLSLPTLHDVQKIAQGLAAPELEEVQTSF